MNPSQQLRSLIDEPGLAVSVGIFDAVSARLAAEAGFACANVGSLASGATLYGLPDTGFISLTDMVGQIARAAEAAPTLALVADGEAGFGNAVQTAHAVRAFERAGAAAVHIEDHLFGKHLVRAMQLEDAQRAASKIAAAVDARRDPDFVVIARTDALLTDGLEAAIERANLYAEAGADVAFLPSLAPAEIPRAAAEIAIPVAATAMRIPPQATWDELGAAGLKLVLYHDLAHNAAYKAIKQAMASLRDGRSLDGASRLLVEPGEFDAFLGVDAIREQALRYGVIDPDAARESGY